MSTNVRDRILSNVEIVGECWMWQGAKNENGYPYISVKRRTRRAHRVAYIAWKGEVPGEMPLDHTCHSASADCPGGRTCAHRACVNPDHLEPVTTRTNILRGQNHVANQAYQTSCVNGHPFDLENTRIRRGGSRACKTCQRARNRDYYRRQKADAA